MRPKLPTLTASELVKLAEKLGKGLLLQILSEIGVEADELRC